MQDEFAKIKSMLQGYEARLRAAENKEASCQPIITNRLDNQAFRISEMEALIKAVKLEVDAIRDQVRELQASNRLLKWFAGLVGSAIVIWLVTSGLALIK